jgi:hypothetical protein
LLRSKKLLETENYFFDCETSGWAAENLPPTPGPERFLDDRYFPVFANYGNMIFSTII